MWCKMLEDLSRVDEVMWEEVVGRYSRNAWTIHTGVESAIRCILVNMSMQTYKSKVQGRDGREKSFLTAHGSTRGHYSATQILKAKTRQQSMNNKDEYENGKRIHQTL